MNPNYYISIEDVSFERTFKSINHLLTFLIENDFKLYYFSKEPISLSGKIENIESKYQHHFEKYKVKVMDLGEPIKTPSNPMLDMLNSIVSFIQENQKGTYQLKLKPDIYLLNSDLINKEFALSRSSYIEKRTPNLIIAKIYQTSLYTSIPCDLRPNQILLKKSQYKSFVSKDSSNEQESYTYGTEWHISKDFLYIKTPYLELKNITGLKKEVLKKSFELHQTYSGKEFRSGEVKNEVLADTKYKGLGDFLGKNKELIPIFKHIGNGYYTLNLPIFDT